MSGRTAPVIGAAVIAAVGVESVAILSCTCAASGGRAILQHLIVGGCRRRYLPPHFFFMRFFSAFSGVRGPGHWLLFLIIQLPALSRRIGRPSETLP